MLCNSVAQQKPGRIYWMDAARVVAIILVVLTHASEVTGFPNVLSKSIFYSIDRLGVPLFFMLSGALLLTRAAKLEIGEYYKKYWKRIVQFILLFFIYSVITNFVYYFVTKGASAEEAIKEAYRYSGLSNRGWKHAVQLWYMDVIIAFYVFCPFLSRLVSTTSTKGLCIFIAIMTLQLINVTFMNRTLGSMFHPYIVYFIAGYTIIERMKNIHFKYDHIVYCSVILLSIALSIITDCRKMEFAGWIHWYPKSYTIFFGGIALLMLIRKVFSQARPRYFISLLSRHSFGIFLIHQAILYSIVKIIPISAELTTCRTLVYTVVAFLISLGISILLSKIPVLRKLVI